METTDTLKAVTMLKTYFWWIWLTDGSLWIKLPGNKFLLQFMEKLVTQNCLTKGIEKWAALEFVCSSIGGIGAYY